MVPITSLVIAGTVAFSVAGLAVWVATSSRSFKELPRVEQSRRRKLLLWALAASLAAIAAVYYLLQAPPQVLHWLPLATYFFLACFGSWLLWRSYKLGLRRDLRLVKGLSGRPLNGAERLVRPLAVTNLLCGLAVLALLVAIPLLRLPIEAWGAVIAAISATYSTVLSHLERKSAA